MQEKASPGIIAGAAIVLIIFVCFLGWKFLSRSGSQGSNANPYANHKGPIPGASGGPAAYGGNPGSGPAGGGSGGPGGGAPSSYGAGSGAPASYGGGAH